MKRLTIVFLVLCFVFFACAHAMAATPKEILKEVFGRALKDFYQQNYDEAVVLFEQTLKIYPDFAEAYFYLGLCYQAKGADIDKVMSMFEKAIEKKPDYSQAYENLGKLYYKQNNYDEAEKYFLKALEHDPDLVSVNLSLGWIGLLAKSDPSEAIYYFEKAIDQTDLSYAYLGLGMAYILDNQKFKVLEMITSLRQMGKEDMALELEHMTRKKNFSLPNLKQAMEMQKKDEQRIQAAQTGVADFSFDYESAANMKVRLSAPPSQGDPPPTIYKQQSDTYRESLPTAPNSMGHPNGSDAADERIEALKNRGKSIFK